MALTIPSVQMAAKQALDHIDRDWAKSDVARQAIPGLVAALNDWKNCDWRAAVTALHLLGWQPEKEIERVLHALAHRKWDAVATMGAEAVEPLAVILEHERDEYVREAAAKTLGKIGSARAVEPLVTFAHKDQKSAQTTVTALQLVIERAGSDIAPEALRLVATLDNVVQIHDHSQCNHSWTTTETIDCSHLRQLARQELIRRGLEV
jgi:HEAT repeats